MHAVAQVCVAHGQPSYRTSRPGALTDPTPAHCTTEIYFARGIRIDQSTVQPGMRGLYLSFNPPLAAVLVSSSWSISPAALPRSLCRRDGNGGPGFSAASLGLLLAAAGGGEDDSTMLLP